MPDTAMPGRPSALAPSALGNNNMMDPPVDTKSLQQTLTRAIDRFVVCKFLVGTCDTATLSGIMKNVGNSFFVLLDPCTNAETTCDMYSLKFITSYPEGIPDNEMYCNRRLYDIY